MTSKISRVRGTLTPSGLAVARLLVQPATPHKYCRAVNVSVACVPESAVSSSASARVSIVCADPNVPNLGMGSVQTYNKYIATDAPWQGASFFIPYSLSYDASIGIGPLAGRIPLAISGATLSDGGVNLIGGVTSYVNYAPGLVVDTGLTGTFSFDWTPTEIAPSATPIAFFDYSGLGENVNDLVLFLGTDNIPVIRKGFSDDTFDYYIFLSVVDGVTPYEFTHLAGTTYHVELRFNLTPGTGVSRLFVDGILVATTLATATDRVVGSRASLTIGNTAQHECGSQVGRISNFMILPGIADTPGAQPIIQYICTSKFDSRLPPRAEFNLMQLPSAVETRVPPMGPIDYRFYPYIVRVYAPVEFLATVTISYV